MGRKRKANIIIKGRGFKPQFINIESRFVSENPHLPVNKEFRVANQQCSKALIYKSELAFLGRCILDSPNIETGGQLFGYWTASGTPVVAYALGPGPRANHQVPFFNQDVEYLESVGKALISRFGLMHIGEWHSHHQLGLDCPSGHDANTMQHSIDRLHLSRFLLCIGNCRGSQFSIKPYVFFENQTEYSSAEWEIKDDHSPFRDQIDAYLSDMHTAYIPKRNLSWFDDKSNRIQLKNMIDYMRALPGAVESKAQLNGGTVELVTAFPDREETISFPNNFPNSPITIRINYVNGMVKETKGGFGFEDITPGSLFDIFRQQYNTFRL